VPVGAVLEGGYALDALARSVAATLEALGAPADVAGSSAADGVAVAPIARDALARLTAWWPGLG
jgi:acetoin utilization deacetylase AcuC-like enzyme